MLIAHLEVLSFAVNEEGGEAYCGTDPLDGRMLTPWLNTITQVEDHLIDNEPDYRLNLGAYAGVSDVPARISDDGTEEPEHESITCGCPSIPCH